jgi:hypothetical protein
MCWFRGKVMKILSDRHVNGGCIACGALARLCFNVPTM